MDRPVSPVLLRAVDDARAEVGLRPLTAEGWNPKKQWRAPKGGEGGGRFIEMPDIRARIPSGETPEQGIARVKDAMHETISAWAKDYGLEVTRSSRLGGKVEQFELFDPATGEPAGEIRRVVREPDEVTNDLFVLRSAYQGRGMGGDLTRRLEEELVRAAADCFAITAPKPRNPPRP